MASATWIGTDGDWNDPSNWQGGSVPSPNDNVNFPVSGNETIEGSAYIGSLFLLGSSLTISGVFAFDNDSNGNITDSALNTSQSTLTIDPWGSLSLNALNLQNSMMIDQGLLLTQNADVETGILAGSSAEWFSSSTFIEQSLSVTEGAAIEGNFTLLSGASLITDGSSIVSGGTIVADGASTIRFEVPSGVEPLSPLVLSDDISVSDGADLSIVSPNGTPVTIQGNVTGNGTITLIGASLVVSAPAAPEAAIKTKPFKTEAAVRGTSSSYELTSSVLDLTLQSPNGSQSAVVSCFGDADAVYAGSQAVEVTSSGARLIDFHGGNGVNTVSAGSSILSYVQGSGAAIVVCGTSGQDSVQAGGGSSTILSSSGAQILVRGSGPTTVAGGSGADLVDARGANGSLVAYGNIGLGVSSVYGGAGSLTVQGASGTLYVQGGSGNLTAWGGTSGDDTIVGGSGKNTIVGGVGAFIVGNGTGGGVYGLSASSGTIDDSASSGSDTIFATGGQGVARFIDGSGTDINLGGRATLDATCGSGTDYVWGGGGTNDTLTGGAGSDVLQGGSAATITTNGRSANFIISNGDGTNVDCSNTSGVQTVFAFGQGTTSIIGGSGELVAVVIDTSCIVNTGGANDVIWCGDNSSASVTGNGYTTFIAGGSGDNLNASSDTGNNTFSLGSANGCLVTTGLGKNYVVAGSSSATVNGSAGSTTIFGGGGNLDVNLSTAPSTFGSIIMLDYDPSHDQLNFGASDVITEVQTSFGIELETSHERVLLYQYYGHITTTHS